MGAHIDQSFLLQYEAALRLAAFGLAVGAMATWETLAPFRARREPRLRRWRTNFGVAFFNVLVLRVALPTTAIGIAQLAGERGWGLFNAAVPAGWLAVLMSLVALD